MATQAKWTRGVRSAAAGLVRQKCLMLGLSCIAFTGHADLQPPNARELSGPLEARGVLATLQCLKLLVTATGRADVDVLKNGDLAIYTDRGLRIEKSNGRHAIVDPNGNCATTSVAGKLFDRNAFNAIVLAGYKRLASKDAVDRVCAQSDRPVLKNLVRPAGGAPNLTPPPAAR